MDITCKSKIKNPVSTLWINFGEHKVIICVWQQKDNYSAYQAYMQISLSLVNEIFIMSEQILAHFRTLILPHI